MICSPVPETVLPHFLLSLIASVLSIFHFCRASCASFDWWCFDWADSSVIRAGWFPLCSQRTGCLSVCLQAADTWSHVAAALHDREKREIKGRRDLTFCWTLNRTVGITIGGRCFLWGKLKCLNGVWAHKREIKEMGKKDFFFYWSQLISVDSYCLGQSWVVLMRIERRKKKEQEKEKCCQVVLLKERLCLITS